MKKHNIIITFILILIVLFSTSIVFAESIIDTSISEVTTGSGSIVELKDKTNAGIQKYNEKYGEEFGFVGYILAQLRVYSIPICFLGIIVGAISCFVIGAKRLDQRQKGYYMMTTFVIFLVIAQVLPLIFALVVMMK